MPETEVEFDESGNLFAGQMMLCALCDTVQQSKKEEESDWRAIVLDGTVYYVCPAHLPPGGAGAEAFRSAYVAILKRLAQLKAKGE